MDELKYVLQCFAWSPHPSYDDLIAIGQTVGKVELVRLEATKYARDNVLSGGRVVSLTIRSSRACNALGFSSHNPSLLAVGLDKVKADPSLIVLDIETASSLLRLGRGLDDVDTLHAKTHASASRAGAQKPDLRTVHTYAPTDVVTSVAFLPQSGDLLAASVSHRWLRIYDLRRQGNEPAQAVASQVNNIATDPFDQHRIACFGDSRLTIWDARRLSQPLILFTDQDASADGARSYRNNISCSAAEFSHNRRGMLATLQKDANHVRFWDIRRAPMVEFEQMSADFRARDYRDSSQSSKLSRLSWAAPTILSWTAPTERPQSPKEPPPNGNITILADTRRSKLTFGVCPFTTCLTHFSEIIQRTSHVICAYSSSRS